MRILLILTLIMIPFIFAGCPPVDDDDYPELDYSLNGFWETEQEQSDAGKYLFFSIYNMITHRDSLCDFSAYNMVEWTAINGNLGSHSDYSYHYRYEINDNDMVLTNEENTVEYSRPEFTAITADSLVIDCSIPSGYGMLYLIHDNEYDTASKLRTFYESGIHQYIFRPDPSFVNGEFAIDLIGIEDEKIVSIERQYYSIEY